MGIQVPLDNAHYRGLYLPCQEFFMEFLDTPYDRIKSVADAHGISISRIEKDLGFAEKQIKKWKNSMPNSAGIMKVADYLGVSVDYLLGREMPKDEKDELLENLARNPELKAFMMTASKCTPEELKALEGMIKAWKRSLD